MNLPVVQAAVPVSGDTIQIANSDNSGTTVLLPAAALSALTLSFPLDPHNGQCVTIVSSKDIAALTLTGGTFSSTANKMLANQPLQFVYEYTSATWWLILNQTDIVSTVQRVWQNGVQKTLVKQVLRSATVSGGVATFDLTDAGGAAILANAYKESAQFWIEDGGNTYTFSGYTLAADKKTLSVTVKRIGISVGVLVFTSAANGSVVYLQLTGD